MNPKPAAFSVALIAIIGGLALQTYQLGFLSEGPMSSFLAGLIAGSVLPYLVCSIILFGFHREVPAAVGGSLVLIADLSMHYSVFINPKGSTAAVGLVFMPMVNLALLLPAGLFVGWLISRRAGKKSG